MGSFTQFIKYLFNPFGSIETGNTTNKKKTARTLAKTKPVIDDRYNTDVNYRLKQKSRKLNKRKVNLFDDVTPFISDKAITLTKAGRATGARLSTNLLDSIAKYSRITGLSLKTALGLVTKESTLGNPTTNTGKFFSGKGLTQNINDGNKVYNNSLTSYWRYRDSNPYEQLIKSVDDRIAAGKIAPEDREKYLKWEENNADKQAESYIKYNTGPSLEASFNYYRDYPERYNPGQSNYQEMVDIVGDEVWNSPEVQDWNKKRRLESAGKKSK